METMTIIGYITTKNKNKKMHDSDFNKIIPQVKKRKLNTMENNKDGFHFFLFVRTLLQILISHFFFFICFSNLIFSSIQFTK